MSLSDCAGWNPHLIDEHDGEDGLIDEPGGAERTFVSHVQKGKWCNTRIGLKFSGV